MKKTFAVFCVVFLCAFHAFAQDIQLPAPDKTGGKPLMQALTERQTKRAYAADKDLSMQQLSNLLYAASGLNRPAKHTIPAARNSLDLQVYVALKAGTYLFDAQENKLILKQAGDNREIFGNQKAMFKSAAAVFVYVSDSSKIKGEEKLSFAHAGSAYQNVYLVAASEGLGTVVCGMIDREAIASFLDLPKGDQVLLAQPVGVLPDAAKTEKK